MADEDDFLSRWSRRKRAVEADTPPGTGLDPEPLAETEGEVPGQARNTEREVEPATEEEEAALLEKLGLPVPESLAEGDDFSVFMKAGVPEFLRKRALRVLWRSNPVLANIDGLNDYDEDFTSPELTQKVLATGYQVGRGFVKKVVEKLEDAAEEIVEEVAEAPQAEPPAAPAPQTPEAVSFSDEDDAPTARPRRMKFQT